MSQNIQNQLFEKTNELKILNPKIKLMVGMMATIIIQHPLVPLISGIIASGFLIPVCIFDYKEKKYIKRAKEINEKINNLRDLEVANSIKKDPTAIKNFKYM